MLKIKNLLIGITFALTGFLAFSPAIVSAADACDTNGDGVVSTQEAIQCGTSAAGGNQNSNKAASNVNDTIASIINILSTVGGVIAVIMIIIAGVRYITSAGKQESVTAAKNTILYAVIGLVIIALAQIIVHFVLHKTNTVTTGSGNSGTSSQCANGQPVC